MIRWSGAAYGMLCRTRARIHVGWGRGKAARATFQSPYILWIHRLACAQLKSPLHRTVTRNTGMLQIRLVRAGVPVVRICCARQTPCIEPATTGWLTGSEVIVLSAGHKDRSMHAPPPPTHTHTHTPSKGPRCWWRGSCAAPNGHGTVYNNWYMKTSNCACCGCAGPCNRKMLAMTTGCGPRRPGQAARCNSALAQVRAAAAGVHIMAVAVAVLATAASRQPAAVAACLPASEGNKTSSAVARYWTFTTTGRTT